MAEDIPQEDISEVAAPPRRRDLSYYMVLFFFVGPVWSVVPLSWAYVAHSLLHWRLFSYSLKSQLLFAAALCEVFFSVYHYYLIRKISPPAPNPPGNMVELQNAFKRVLQSGLAALPEDGGDEESLDADRPGSPAELIVQLEHKDERAIDFRNRLRTWFRKAPWSKVRLEHMHAWLYWSTFNASLPPQAEVPDTHKNVLDEAIELLEKRIGCKLQPGSDPSIKPLLLTLDPVNVLSRPLAWYICVKIANICLKLNYENNHGLTYGRFRDLEYLLNVPPDYNRETGPDPIVFIHGLGLGLAQYQQVLSHFVQELQDVPILILLQPQISQDIFHPRFLRPMLRHEKVACLIALLEKLGWVDTNTKESRGVTILSHSNGSYAHAWMLKSYPELITRSCFVDPVTFCSWEGDVCYNFVYRPCTTGVELVIRYFVGTEVGVANLLQRHFDWLSNTLWFEEIPNARDPQRTLFLVGGKDSIVDAERVKRYLTSHGIRKSLIYDPNGRHGQALIAGGKGMSKVIDWLKEVQSSHPYNFGSQNSSSTSITTL